jgi:hypothetical protein
MGRELCMTYNKIGKIGISANLCTRSLVDWLSVTILRRVWGVTLGCCVIWRNACRQHSDSAMVLSIVAFPCTGARMSMLRITSPVLRSIAVIEPPPRPSSSQKGPWVALSVAVLTWWMVVALWGSIISILPFLLENSTSLPEKNREVTSPGPWPLIIPIGT